MYNDSKLSKIAISINGSLSNFYGTSQKTNMRWFEAPLAAQPVEWRGIWMTPRNGGVFWTKADIARAMDSVANNNVNLVYFNVWSRGESGSEVCQDEAHGRYEIAGALRAITFLLAK